MALLKKIPLGSSEMNTIRGRAEELREGTLCDYRPVLPLMLASFIFDVLCAPGKTPAYLPKEKAPWGKVCSSLYTFSAISSVHSFMSVGSCVHENFVFSVRLKKYTGSTWFRPNAHM